MPHKIKKVTPEHRTLAYDLATKLKVSWSDIISGSHKQSLHTARIHIAKSLKNLGYSDPAIGDFMHKTPSNVAHYLKKSDVV